MATSSIQAYGGSAVGGTGLRPEDLQNLLVKSNGITRYIYDPLVGETVNFRRLTFTADGEFVSIYDPINGVEQTIDLTIPAKVFTCTEPAWPDEGDMFAEVLAGNSVTIERLGFSGEIREQWDLVSATNRTVPPQYYSMKFLCRESHKAKYVEFSSTDLSTWTITETEEEIPERTTIARNFSTADWAQYHKDTLVYRSNMLYRCKVPTITPNTWVPSEWEQTTIAEELARKGEVMKKFILLADADASYTLTGNDRAAQLVVLTPGRYLSFKPLSANTDNTVMAGFKAGDTVKITAAKVKSAQAPGLQTPAIAVGVNPGLSANLEFRVIALASDGTSVGSLGDWVFVKELDWNKWEDKDVEFTLPSTLPAGATCFGLYYTGTFNMDDFNIQSDYVGQTVEPELVFEVTTSSEKLANLSDGTDIS